MTDTELRDDAKAMQTPYERRLVAALKFHLREGRTDMDDWPGLDKAIDQVRDLQERTAEALEIPRWRANQAVMGELAGEI